MPFQVVHAQYRFVQRRTQRTCHACANQQRARQAWPACKCHHIHILQSFARILHDLFRQRQHAANMVTTGQLGHHAAIRTVHINLAVQGM